MTDERPLPAKQIEHYRTRVIEALSEHFAQDRLTMDELDTLIGRAYTLQTPAALDELLTGLPPLTPSDGVPPTAVTVPVKAAPAHRTLVALMSGVVRRGAWPVPRKMTVIAVMGGVEIDLRSTPLPDGVTEIRALAVMGGVVVTVPPGVRVESNGFAIMGGFEDQLDRPGATSPDAPVVRLSGFALMGGVEVKVAERLTLEK
jgi:hypothetical protein